MIQRTARKERANRVKSISAVGKRPGQDISAEQLRAILQSSPIPVFVIGKDHKILYWNRALEELSGIQAGKVIGTRLHWKAFYDEERPVMADLLVDEAPDRIALLYAGKFAKSKLIADAYEAIDFFPSLGEEGKWIRFTTALIRDSRGGILGALVTLEDTTERKKAEEKLVNFSEQLRGLSARLEMVREEERAAISREIHDELGQALTALKMDLAWLSAQQVDPPEGFVEKTQAMSKLIDTTLASVRKISSELRPWVLDELGLMAAIEWQAQQFQGRTGIRCNFPRLAEDLPLDRDRSTAVFRILQETLTNVARHAKATKVAISLAERKGQVVLTVKDNGKGITQSELSDQKSLGLLGMKERAHLFGGKIRIVGKPGKGTAVILVVPKDRPLRRSGENPKVRGTAKAERIARNPGLQWKKGKTKIAAKSAGKWGKND